jgi:hypothetical protein
VPVSIRITFYARTQATSQTGKLRWNGYFAALPPSSFSEMSPVCFRPAFDGIREVWFAAAVVKKRSVMDNGGTGGLLGTSSIF